MGDIIDINRYRLYKEREKQEKLDLEFRQLIEEMKRYNNEHISRDFRKNSERKHPEELYGPSDRSKRNRKVLERLQLCTDFGDNVVKLKRRKARRKSIKKPTYTGRGPSDAGT